MAGADVAFPKVWSERPLATQPRSDEFDCPAHSPDDDRGTGGRFVLCRSAGAALSSCQTAGTNADGAMRHHRA
jgi:hypothetical protein